MKIAIVYDVVYPFSHGGGEKRNWEIARRLAAHGHEVWLVSMQMWDGPPVIVREKVHLAGVCPLKPGLCKAGRRSLSEPFYFARHLRSFLRHNKFDLIDCSNFPYLPCLAARAATLFGRTRLVITWYEARGLKRWLLHRGLAGLAAWIFERMVSRLTDLNVAISGFTAGRVRQILGIKDAAVIPCGVDAAHKAPSIHLARKRQILSVGRLVPHKRIDMLLEVFHKLHAKFPDHVLKIVGEGHEKERLVRMAAHLGIANKVIFLEGIDEAGLRLEYEESQVFVLPSELEGFGIVLLEAMAAGTPVLALDAPGSAARDLINDGENGLLVRNSREMLDVLGRLLADNELRNRLIAAGRLTAEAHDWETVILPMVLKYYEAAIGKG